MAIPIIAAAVVGGGALLKARRGRECKLGAGGAHAARIWARALARHTGTHTRAQCEAHHAATVARFGGRGCAGAASPMRNILHNIFFNNTCNPPHTPGRANTPLTPQPPPPLPGGLTLEQAVAVEENADAITARVNAKAATLRARAAGRAAVLVAVAAAGE